MGSSIRSLTSAAKVWRRQNATRSQRLTVVVRLVRAAVRQELPFIGEAQLVVITAEIARKRIEGRGEAQDAERRLIDVRPAARAPDQDLREAAVRADRDFEHRIVHEL